MNYSSGTVRGYEESTTVYTAGRTQCSASDAVIQRLTPQKYRNVFKNKVHVAANLRLCTIKFYLFRYIKAA